MPSSTNGKICYVELPAVDVARSAAFYERVFGWRMRRRGDGATAFDDTTGQVSGAFVTGRAAVGTGGMLVYVMVDDIEAAVRAVVEAGGMIVQQVGVDTPELTARFRDPGGNVVGLYQEPVKAKG